jgi:hypothetical protein
MLRDILDFFRNNWRALCKLIIEHRAWIAFVVTIVNSLLLFDLLYSHVLFGGAVGKWPDAIACCGKAGTTDTSATLSIYYLTHFDHGYSGTSVVSYRLIGSKPHTLHFDKHTERFHVWQDKELLNADCEGKTLDWLTSKGRGLYFLSRRPLPISH